MPQQTSTLPRQETVDDQGSGVSGWIVIVFDNDHNTFEQVISILQKATGCNLAEAELETWEVHHLGRSLVHHGDRPECERVGAIIRTIGIRVSVDQL